MRKLLLLLCLCVPAANAIAQVDDHLECHKVKDPQAKQAYTADIDGLLARSGCVIKTPAALACVPATKSNVVPAPPGTGGNAPTYGYFCYKVKCPKAELPTFAGSDQFGSRTVAAKSTKLLCAPLAPPMTTTTTSTTTTTTSTTLPTDNATFRMSDLELRDPHVFTDVGVCFDLTTQVNQDTEDQMTMDGNSDSNLDLSPLITFTPLDQAIPGAGSFSYSYGDCTAPSTGTTCTLGSTPNQFLSSNMATTCLDTVAGTTRATYGVITLPGGPCFVGAPGTITLPFLGTSITLRDAQIGATYIGDPATGLSNGLLMGFLTEADANATFIPASVAVVGGRPLSEVLPGGTGNCRTGTNSDLDTNDATTGWWFYFNFPAYSVAVNP